MSNKNQATAEGVKKRKLNEEVAGPSGMQTQPKRLRRDNYHELIINMSDSEDEYSYAATNEAVTGTAVGNSAGNSAGTSDGTCACMFASTFAATFAGTSAGTIAGTFAGTSAGTFAGTSADTSAGTIAGTFAGTFAGTSAMSFENEEASIATTQPLPDVVQVDKDKNFKIMQYDILKMLSELNLLPLLSESDSETVDSEMSIQE